MFQSLVTGARCFCGCVNIFSARRAKVLPLNRFMTLMLAVFAQSNCPIIPHNEALLERCLGASLCWYPNRISISPANKIANAPLHCIHTIGSSGSKIDALIIATTTSEIVKIPTRPGNNSCDTRKMIQKHGSMIMIDQTAAVGKALVTKVISGGGAP